jgi:hypothetical protein
MKILLTSSAAGLLLLGTLPSIAADNVISENGTGGFYLFGSQRIWGRSSEKPSSDGKGQIIIPASQEGQNAYRRREQIPAWEVLGTNLTVYFAVLNPPDPWFQRASRRPEVRETRLARAARNTFSDDQISTLSFARVRPV